MPCSLMINFPDPGVICFMVDIYPLAIRGQYEQQSMRNNDYVPSRAGIPIVKFLVGPIQRLSSVNV